MNPALSTYFMALSMLPRPQTEFAAISFHRPSVRSSVSEDLAA